MGQTQNYGIPYPECAPPLQKDAGDVADFRDLAEGADDALDQVYAQASQQVFNPDAARMSMSAVLTTTGQDTTPFFNARSFDTTAANVMTPLTTGGITIVEPGRYWCSTWVLLTSATALAARMRFLFNGATISNFQSPAFNASTNTSYVQCAVVLSLDTTGLLRSMIRHTAPAATSFQYSARISCLQLEKY